MPHFFCRLSFTFCFVRPLCILRILILYMWYKYLLPKVGHLSYKLVYIVFCHIQDFVLLSVVSILLLPSLWGSCLPLKGILPPSLLEYYPQKFWGWKSPGVIWKEGWVGARSYLPCGIPGKASGTRATKLLPLHSPKAPKGREEWIRAARGLGT